MPSRWRWHRTPATSECSDPRAAPADELGLALDARVYAPIGLDLHAETPEQIALAIAGELQAVAHGAVARHLRDRARPLHAEIACAVLAAGGSHRLGRPKQLVEHAGAPLVTRAARACATIGPVGVVLGAHADTVGAALGELAVARIANPGWEEGSRRRSAPPCGGPRAPPPRRS